MKLRSWPGALCGLALLAFLCNCATAVERHYYIAAVNINWDYTSAGQQRTGPSYKKVVYREYNEGFTQAKSHPLSSGLLGPTLRGQEGDTIIVKFKNMADHPCSIHPHGIAYGKQSEGSLYFDNTSLFEKEDDVILPGQEHTYQWKVTSEVTPTAADPPCITYTYLSHFDIVKDYNTGLIGTMLICKKGTLDSSGNQINFHQEAVLLFGVFNENKSWYSTGGPEEAHNVKYTINGYTNGSVPDLDICVHSKVSWHLLGMSSETDLFSVHFNGQVLLHDGHKTSSVGIISGSATSASMTGVHPGRWLISSHISRHLEAGLHGYLNIKMCDEYTAPKRWLTIQQKQKSQECTYYIAAEEIIWDYAPNMPENMDGDFRSLSEYLKQGPRRIGKKYKKAVFTQYKDGTFKERAEDKEIKKELGILGPVITAQIGNVIKIVFKNKASRPYSIYPHGLTIDKAAEGASYPAGGNQTHGIQPGEIYTYTWSVSEEDIPTDSDPRCLTRMYHSAVDTPRDIASDLVGPLLICKSQSLNKTNVQLRVDKEQHVMFTVFDENKSWYHDENINTYCSDPKRVQRDDPEFYKSNVMHTINGYVYESGQELGFCNGETVAWYVSSVGEQDYIQTATFYGHTFELKNREEDILSLFPMTGETITMNMLNIGIWLLASLNSHGSTKGMRVKFKDLECFRDYVKEYDYEPEKNIFDGPVSISEIKKDDPKPTNPTFGSSNKVLNESTEEALLDMTSIFDSKPQVMSTTTNAPITETYITHTMNKTHIFPTNISITSSDAPVGERNIMTTLYVPKQEQGKDFDEAEEHEYVEHKHPYSKQANTQSPVLDISSQHFLKTAGEKDSRTYFISVEEEEWDYAGYGQRRLDRSSQNERPTAFKKAVFRKYLDSTFTVRDIRGEMEEHLGILGPVIKAEVDQTVMVFFRNHASLPYSLHANGVKYLKQMEGLSYDDQSPYWYKQDDAVLPNSTFIYTWTINSKSGPQNNESDCRTWTYYSAVNPERDINSGLIGPLLVCRKGTLDKKPLDRREFILLFMTFDENKSWYYEENRERIERKNKRAVMNPNFLNNLKFDAINGIIYSLKGLRMYTNQLAKWHLINMGSPKDLHSVHFHGQTFINKVLKDHRQGIHPLLPGGFATLEMLPSKPGLWQLESEVGLSQQRGMQTLFLVLNNVCDHPLGLISGTVKDERITASDSRGQWYPHLARLHNTGKYNAWSTEKTGQHIQVDFQRPVAISKVATQGAKQFLKHNFVLNYTISYSIDKKKWTFYKGDSATVKKTFEGNSDAFGTKENIFFPPFIGRYVRLHPLHSYNDPAVRLEYYGCELDGCSLPLGMESGLIKDTQITASSVASSLYQWHPWYARLNKNGTVNAWQAKNNDTQPWIQVDLKDKKKITGIITQGGKSLGNEMFVSAYTLEYSEDGKRWTNYTNDDDYDQKTFQGNTDSNGQVKNYIYQPIFSRFIRIIPKQWQKSITMRIELLGCDLE
uniref:ferroxidase n=1 Tax=Cyprinus carpio carpio TaxID=630221 RepID=A0A8C1HP48_CYPCA